MSQFSCLGCRNGFPFPIRELAEDGETFKKWDGSTVYEGTASRSDSKQVTVYGPKTIYPLGFTLLELAELYWRVKTLKVSYTWKRTETSGGYSIGNYNVPSATDVVTADVSFPAVAGNWYWNMDYTVDYSDVNYIEFTDACALGAEAAKCIPRNLEASIYFYGQPTISRPKTNPGTASSLNFAAGELDALVKMDITGYVETPYSAGYGVTHLLRIQFDGVSVIKGDDGLFYPVLELAVANYSTLPILWYFDGMDVEPVMFPFMGKELTLYGPVSGAGIDPHYHTTAIGWEIAGSVEAVKYWSYGGLWDVDSGAFQP